MDPFRISKEFQDPEDSRGKGQRRAKKAKTVIVTYKPSKSKMSEFYNEFKSALKSENVEKINELLENLTDSEKNDKVRRSYFRSVPQSNDEEEAGYKGEVQTERSYDDMEKLWKDYVKKMMDSTPDPVVTNRGLTTSYKNFTLYGITKGSICGKIRKSFNTWRGDLCFSKLTSSVSSETGPGVPFKGKVSAIFTGPKIEFSFSKDASSEKIHITRAHLIVNEKTKFIPTYDSNIPLNPWSKVSMSGYMVARIKKIMPNLVENMILRICHVVEKL